MGQTAVVPSQIVNIPTSSLIYRKTAGTGSGETNTLATLKTDLGLTGTNTGDQSLAAYAEPSASNVGSYHLLTQALNPNRWQYLPWLPQVSTTINYWGGGNNPTATGTLSHAALAITNYRTSKNRSVVTGSASAGNFVQLIENNATVYFGDAAGRGGFFFSTIFAVEAAVSASIGLWGLAAAQPAAATTESSAHVSFFGLACDSTDTNLQIMHNDATGTATKIDLGASFPARTANTVFRLFLFSDQNTSTVQYQIDRLDSAASASGTLSTNLPTNQTLLKKILRESNGATAAACILNMFAAHCWVKY